MRARPLLVTLPTSVLLTPPSLCWRCGWFPSSIVWNISTWFKISCWFTRSCFLHSQVKSANDYFGTVFIDSAYTYTPFPDLNPAFEGWMISLTLLPGTVSLPPSVVCVCVFFFFFFFFFFFSITTPRPPAPKPHTFTPSVTTSLPRSASPPREWPTWLLSGSGERWVALFSTLLLK